MLIQQNNNHHDLLGHQGHHHNHHEINYNNHGNQYHDNTITTTIINSSEEEGHSNGEEISHNDLNASSFTAQAQVQQNFNNVQGLKFLKKKMIIFRKDF